MTLTFRFIVIVQMPFNIDISQIIGCKEFDMFDHIMKHGGQNVTLTYKGKG